MYFNCPRCRTDVPIIERFCPRCWGASTGDRDLAIRDAEIWRLTSDALGERALELKFWRNKRFAGIDVPRRHAWIDLRDAAAEMPTRVEGVWHLFDARLTLTITTGVEMVIQLVKWTPRHCTAVDQSERPCELTLLDDHWFVLFAPADRRKALLMVNGFKSKLHLTSVAEYFHPSQVISVQSAVRARPARLCHLVTGVDRCAGHRQTSPARAPCRNAGVGALRAGDRSLPFNLPPAADLTSWDGDFQHPQYRLFMSDIETVIPEVPRQPWPPGVRRAMW